MDKREFTSFLLAGADGHPPAPAASPVSRQGTERRVLVVAELPERQALPVLQEAWALRRFDFRVEALVPEAALARLSRFAPPGTLFSANAPIDADAVLENVHALVAVPSQDLLAKLALGLQERPAAQEILQALWRGIPVYMDFSYALGHRGMTCRNPALGALYDRYAQLLRAFGTRDLAPGTYLSTLRGASPESPAPAPSPKQGGGRRVVTREDVLSHDPGAAWTLPADAILTPLARDEAKKRGLSLTKENLTGSDRKG